MGQGQDALPGPSAGAQIPGGNTTSAPNPPLAAVSPHLQNATVAKNYRLGTGDKMKITVYGEPDLSGDFSVDGSGQVQFPLIGQIEAAGLTTQDFVEALTKVLGAKYLKDPKVSVEIENYRPFYIMGEVNKPGEYPYENGLNVLGAVALAGGFTYRANDSDVYIHRSGEPNERAQRATSDTKILPGDVVRIPERIF
jgi:polysaccharide export outer membrane protein